MDDLRAVRLKYRITQEEAARLLGISKNTWIRWEKNAATKSRYKEQAGRLLVALFNRRRPEPCSTMRRLEKLNWETFDYHLRQCKECQLLVSYFALVMHT